MSTRQPLPAGPVPPKTTGLWRLFGCLSLIIFLPAMLVLLVMGGIMPKSMLPILSLWDTTRSFIQETTDQAKSSKALQKALGLPMEETSLPLGGVRRSEGRTSGSCQLDLKGPKGEATVHAQANREGKVPRWRYTVFEAELENGTVIDLKPPGD